MTPTKIYKVVPIGERLPEDAESYHTSLGLREFGKYQHQPSMWYDSDGNGVFPTYWLEEVKEPVHVLTPYELENMVVLFSRKREWYLGKGHSTESAWRTFLIDYKSAINYLDSVIEEIKSKEA